ncbi:MAG TPA: Piwi domain-containing protein [Pyrinomonadaceae bacterium]|nr:Piwi domain-containing protein [Pyrinomonadaceae bacterium]
MIIPERAEEAYRQCKTILLSNGVPCQFVTAVKLQNPSQRPWVLGNIALATYAKVGGTPWVVADSAAQQELVMGISRAQERGGKRYVVGFVTLFNQEGDFLLLHSKSPVVAWEDYVSGLEELIVDAYHEYENKFGTAETLVIHFHKRPGYKELEAVNNALNHLGRIMPYALLHLNEFSAFRLFDSAHSSHVPQAGLTVNLSRHRALLLLDGRQKGKRNRMGVPNVWDIGLDKRSTMELDEFPRLVTQVQRFAKVNWRGFNARSLPVTINYSKLICDQVLDMGAASWNSIIGNGKLRDKAWFL